MVETWTSELVGSAAVKSVNDLQKYQSWDSEFRSGEYGVFTLNFPIPLLDDLPNWMAVPYWIEGKYTPVELSKVGISEFVTSYCEAKGIILYQPTDWKGGTLCVYFQTVLGAMLIAAIIVGVLITIGIITITVSLYKIKKAQVEAQGEAVIQRQEGALEIISGITDEGLRSEALVEYLEGTKPEKTGLQFDLGFEKPMIILAIMGGLALILLVYLKGGA